MRPSGQIFAVARDSKGLDQLASKLCALASALIVRPGGIVVGVHDPEQLDHLNGVPEHSDPEKQDVILVSVKPGDPAQTKQTDEPDQVVSEWEVRVFTTAVAAAEDAGKPVVLVGLIGDRPYGTVLQAARALQSTTVVVGVSEQGLEAQTKVIHSDWHHMSNQGSDVHLKIVPDQGAPTCIDLNPPMPRLAERSNSR